jgi:hypothetical protein
MTAPTMTPAPPEKPTSRRTLGITAFGIALLLLGLLGGLLIGRVAFTTAEPAGLAPTAITDMLTARVAAVNGGDPAAIASFYADDAVLTETDQMPPVVTETSIAIGQHMADYQAMGFRLQQTGGAIISLGPLVTEPLLWSGGVGGLVTYSLNSEGKIARQWVTGASLPEMNGP